MADDSEKSKIVTIVSGLPRSGTSMMMRMLEVGGLEILTDSLRQADEDNPHGYYELEQVKALARGDHQWIEDARGRVVKVVSPLLRYLPEGYEYRVILMRRDMDEVLASQREMLMRRGQPSRTVDDSRLAQLYEEDLSQIEGWMERNENVSFLQVDYNKVLATPASELRRVSELIEADLDLEAMSAVVDPALYRQRG